MNKDLWFKARRYGWGWTPVSWQGWAVVVVFIVVAVLGRVFLDAATPSGSAPTLEQMVIYYGVLLASLSFLLWICYTKGERPRWSWGDPHTKTKKGVRHANKH